MPRTDDRKRRPLTREDDSNDGSSSICNSSSSSDGMDGGGSRKESCSCSRFNVARAPDLTEILMHVVDNMLGGSDDSLVVVVVVCSRGYIFVRSDIAALHTSYYTLIHVHRKIMREVGSRALDTRSYHCTIGLCQEIYL
uniref:Uncharacterized protein n=1 Tax=Vespula pensylvanica TaxID=30213 RepID=A0A834P130_VESPE|nr:hypothetical protein H0235_008997 [Vespula pensylvanica]